MKHIVIGDIHGNSRKLTELYTQLDIPITPSERAAQGIKAAEQWCRASDGGRPSPWTALSGRRLRTWRSCSSGSQKPMNLARRSGSGSGP